MNISTRAQDRQVTIEIRGAFDFKAHHQFRQAYEDQPRDWRYVLDFQGVTAVDSSALGMLLIMREYAGGDDADVAIVNPSREVRKILEVARFQELFKL